MSYEWHAIHEAAKAFEVRNVRMAATQVRDRMVKIAAADKVR
jgi:hypothetical protein